VSKRGALALVTLAHGLGSLSILATAPLSPFLLDGLALSRVQVGLFLPAAYLGGMLFALPAGWLTERRGVRWPLALEMLGFFSDDLHEGVAALKERRAPAFPSARSK